MPDDLTFGISRVPGEFIDDISVKDSISVFERKNRVGTTARVFAFDPKAEVSIKGGGTPILALGIVAEHGVTGLAAGGVFLVKDREASESNEKTNEFSISATHYPSASAGTVPAAAPAGGGA